MVGCSIQLYYGVLPPSWPIKVKLSSQFHEEEQHSLVVGVRLQERVEAVSKVVNGGDDGDTRLDLDHWLRAADQRMLPSHPSEIADT